MSGTSFGFVGGLLAGAFAVAAHYTHLDSIQQQSSIPAPAVSPTSQARSTYACTEEKEAVIRMEGEKQDALEDRDKYKGFYEVGGKEMVEAVTRLHDKVGAHQREGRLPAAVADDILKDFPTGIQFGGKKESPASPPPSEQPPATGSLIPTDMSAYRIFNL